MVFGSIMAVTFQLNSGCGGHETNKRSRGGNKTPCPHAHLYMPHALFTLCPLAFCYRYQRCVLYLARCQTKRLRFAFYHHTTAGGGRSRCLPALFLPRTVLVRLRQPTGDRQTALKAGGDGGRKSVGRGMGGVMVVGVAGAG